MKKFLSQKKKDLFVDEDDGMAPEMEGGDQSSTKKRGIAKLFQRRPSLRKSKQAGTEGAPTHVFGSPLTALVGTQYMDERSGVPKVIRACVDFVERHGLKEEGVYRLSSQKSQVEQLQAQFDSGKDVDLEALYSDRLFDGIHLAANVLKLFIRSLPEPLLSDALLSEFEALLKLSREDDMVAGIITLLARLPSTYYLTLGWIVHHINHVEENGAANKMTWENIAVIFSPALGMSLELLSLLHEWAEECFPDVHISVAKESPNQSPSPSSTNLLAVPSADSSNHHPPAPVSSSSSSSSSSSTSNTAVTFAPSSTEAATATTTAPAAAPSLSSAAKSEDVIPTDDRVRMEAEIRFIEESLAKHHQAMSKCTANGETYPAQLSEEMWDLQRSLTELKRKTKSKTGDHAHGTAYTAFLDPKVGSTAPTRVALADMLTSLYQEMAYQNLEHRAINMLLKARVEQEKHVRRQLTQELTSLAGYNPSEPARSMAEIEPDADEEMLGLMVEQLKRQQETLMAQRTKLCQDLMEERELAAKARVELNQLLDVRTQPEDDIAAAFMVPVVVPDKKWAYRCFEEDLPLTAAHALDLPSC